MENKISVDTTEIKELKSNLKTNIGGIIKGHKSKKQSIYSRMQQVMNEYSDCYEIYSQASTIIALLNEADTASKRLEPLYDQIISGLEYTISSTKQCERDIKRLLSLEKLGINKVRDKNTRTVRTRGIRQDSDLREEMVEEEIQEETIEEWRREELQEIQEDSLLFGREAIAPSSQDLEIAAAELGTIKTKQSISGMSLQDTSVNQNISLSNVKQESTYMNMTKNQPLAEAEMKMAQYAKAIDDKQLEKINTYTNLLNQSRQEGRGEPQWLLDALTTLGVPYSILSQTATIANHTVLSPEKFKEAREKMQATINEWNAVLFSKENVEKLQGLWENICKQYETERAQALEALQDRLESGNLEALSEEDLAFYNQIPGILNELDIKLSPEKQANLLSCLHIKGNVEAIDLKRFGLTVENGVDEDTLDEISKAITLKYDANYYTNLEAQKEVDKAELWSGFWEDVANHPISKGVTFVAEESYKIIVEAPARLIRIGFNWTQLQAGAITQEEFNKKLDAYCEFADNYIKHLQVLAPSVGCALVDWCCQFGIGTIKLGCQTLSVLEGVTDGFAYLFTGESQQNAFAQQVEKIDEFAAYIHNFYKDLAPDAEMFDNTQMVVSVAMLTKGAVDLVKGVTRLFQRGVSTGQINGASQGLDEIGNILVNENGTISATSGRSLKGILENLGAIVDDMKGALELVVVTDMAIESAAAIEATAVGGLTGGGLPPDDERDSNPSSKLLGKEVDLKWLSDNYKAVEIKGTVKVNGEVRDISRRVYQTEIDWDYIPKDPLAKGLTNKELALKGKAPYAVDKNGVEAKIELHHLTQVEAGSMVEIVATTHDEYTKILHGLVERGGSFRNNLILDKQYSNFLKKYWRWRANNL